MFRHFTSKLFNNKNLFNYKPTIKRKITQNTIKSKDYDLIIPLYIGGVALSSLSGMIYGCMTYINEQQQYTFKPVTKMDKMIELSFCMYGGMFTGFTLGLASPVLILLSPYFMYKYTKNKIAEKN